MKHWSHVGPFLKEERLLALGIAHGITTRALGSMRDEANRKAALAAAGLSAVDPIGLKQVHDVAILPAVAASNKKDGDGLLGAKASGPFAVFMADCIPLYVWAKDGSAFGAFHSGWRGTCAGMPGAAARSFKRPGRELAAAIGPHAKAGCYRVGPEVREKFRPESARGENLDLTADAIRQLIEAGLAAEDISDSGLCTVCSPDLFFSYRREKLGNCMMAFVAP
jgi:YfiH family protein